MVTLFFILNKGPITKCTQFLCPSGLAMPSCEAVMESLCYNLFSSNTFHVYPRCVLRPLHKSHVYTCFLTNTTRKFVADVICQQCYSLGHIIEISNYKIKYFGQTTIINIRQISFESNSSIIIYRVFLGRLCQTVGIVWVTGLYEASCQFRLCFYGWISFLTPTTLENALHALYRALAVVR